MRSRDIDIVLHSNHTLSDFESQFSKWGIAWRRKGRSTFKECRFVDADPYPPIIDVFTTDAEIGAHLFTMHRSQNVAPEVKGQGFLPAVPVLLRLKVRAVPPRSGEDSEDKRAKDLLDIYHLVFQSQANTPPLWFLGQVEARDRLDAAKYVAAASSRRPAHREAYDLVSQWLKRKSP